ncbi:MAG: 3-deoxy-D-manno-octulosonate 8-phosphate phosphatase (KDO 8-P phosphatase) [Bacteriovoracaceae bacterium]|jgi:3-deoxy-D-manno-octulosonate 8-phosphate phosphatase (KDO 8-P phosphatase)
MSHENLDLREISQKYSEKLKAIKICLFDVDGILTNGKIFWASEEVGFNRQFHTHDGYGLKVLMRAGIKVGIITGGDSIGVRKRFEGLGVDHLFMGNEDKRQSFDEILKIENLTDQDALYMGDEFFDLPILKRVGFSATVPNASIEIRESVDYVTVRESGNACVREVIDMLRHAQGIVPEIEY